MTLQAKPLTEITHEAIQVLCREIGVVNTVRFINQFTTGHGNYTEEREQLFGKLSVNDIVSEIKQTRKQNS
jgi:hypothetical protein